VVGNITDRRRWRISSSAHGVDGEVLRSRWRCSSAVRRDPQAAVETGEASRRWQCTLGIGSGLGQWVAAVAVEPRNPNHWPPPPIYSTARRGPTSHVIGLGVPDQDARLGPRYGRWAKSGGDQTSVTFSPLISHNFLRSSISYSKFQFIFFFLLSYFIKD
jgi:hypothetical protein